jgi:hypothetical protein
VVRFLIDDIRNDGALIQFAYRKNTVASLPTEIIRERPKSRCT